ncbi:hypothetical protein ACWGTI_18760 [Mesorhizobium sp. ArgA1]
MLNRELHTLAALLLFISILICPDTAQADEVTPHAELVCKRGSSIALVRFTLTWNDDPVVYRQLPAEVDEGLSATPTLSRSDCTIANGWTIRIRDGQGQAFAHGQGGANPPAFFSLWIAKRKVLSRKEWKPGYALGDNPRMVGVVIRPDRLSYCYAPHNYTESAIGPVTCHDEPLQLERHKVDRIEYAPKNSRPPVGRIFLARGTTEPRLCRKFLRLRPKGIPSAGDINDTANVFPAQSVNYGLDVATIEVSPGVNRKLVRWSRTNHYFDGDLMMFAPVTDDPAAMLNESMLEDDTNNSPADKLPSGWVVIAGNMPGIYPGVSWRYVHFDTQRIDGQLYFLAQPTNWDQRPTAILVQPQMDGFKRVCVFQRVEPHF